MVLASREATLPIGDLGNIVNLPILGSSYSSHFMFSPFVSSPTPRSCVFLFSLVFLKVFLPLHQRRAKTQIS